MDFQNVIYESLPAVPNDYLWKPRVVKQFLSDGYLALTTRVFAEELPMTGQDKHDIQAGRTDGQGNGKSRK